MFCFGSGRFHFGLYFVSFPFQNVVGTVLSFFCRLRTLVSGYKMFFLSLSDGTSLGYISGQGSDPPLPNASAGLVETCDFLAALAPNRKKTSLEFDKQSTYSVCVSTSSSEGRGPYRSGFSLPHIFVYVGWFGCLLTSAIAALFTIWYGVRWVGCLVKNWSVTYVFFFVWIVLPFERVVCKLHRDYRKVASSIRFRGLLACSN